MRLAEYIRANREPILVEWEAFADSCSPASGSMNIDSLRDHADEMLIVIATDLETPQGKTAQAEKSKGQAELDPDITTAAEAHGAGRADSGFSIDQMVAEYRALRASVIRLWTKEVGELRAADIEDLIRFNEAIDQSLAESVMRFQQDLDQSKEIFLAILGHDLRTPLGAISTSAKFMLDTRELAEPHATLVARIVGSATRTLQMVGDLLDFTRGRLGGGIPVARKRVALGRLLREVVDEISAANPTAMIKIDTRSDERGDWDHARLAQALGNVISNAVRHGAPGTAVAVRVKGEPDFVSIAVHNRGVAIPSDQLNGIFNPMKTRSWAPASSAGPTGSLGLGLYIAERIVTAHEGTIAVSSSDGEGTTFTLRLPRHAAAVVPAETALAEERKSA